MKTKDSSMEETQPFLEEEQLKNVLEGPSNKSEETVKSNFGIKKLFVLCSSRSPLKHTNSQN